MPALLINNELYCDTPTVKREEITYEILSAETYNWNVFFPSMSIINGEAHISFRLQTNDNVSLLNTEWLPVLQLSAKPKKPVYGVVNTTFPRNEKLQMYISTEGIVHILPNISMTETSIVADMIAIFETESVFSQNDILNTLGIKSDSSSVSDSLSVENDTDTLYTLYTADDNCTINFSGVITWGNIASGYRQVEVKVDDLIVSGQTSSAYNIGAIYMPIQGFFSLKKGEGIKLTLRHNAGKTIETDIHCMYSVLKC